MYELLLLLCFSVCLLLLYSLLPPACSPEGLIIAVPVYAATNSKSKAIALAAASGLSEPIGALFALFALRPFVVSVERLDYVLAAVGGVMLAVCGLELWPEARKCKQDLRVVQGVLLGAVAMGWTLLVGV
jgi:ZIP family zinc transporter